MGDTEIPDELIDQLLGEYRRPEQLTGPEGLINQLRKRLIELNRPGSGGGSIIWLRSVVGLRREARSL